MNIVIRSPKYNLSAESRAHIEERFKAALKLLGDKAEGALLEAEVEEAPAEGRSSEPFRLVARLTVDNKVFHAEAVKPSPESAADRVRSELENEIRKERGRARRLWKKGHSALKRMLRFE